MTTTRGDLPAELVDLSIGGFGLRMVAPMSPGEFVRVRVQLPTPRGPAWFDPDAVVTRVTRGSGKDAVGVCLVTPSPALADVLATRVCDHLAGRGRGRSRAHAQPTPNEGDTFELAALFRSAVEDVER